MMYIIMTPSSLVNMIGQTIGREKYEDFRQLRKFLSLFMSSTEQSQHRHRGQRRPRTKPRTSHHQSPGGERRGKRKRWTIVHKRTRDGHRQSDEHWYCFKGNVGKTSERRGGAHMEFSERTDSILN